MRSQYLVIDWFYKISRLVVYTCLARFVMPLGSAIIVVAFSTSIYAVDPPPGGGYGDGNTALGTDSLFSLTDGSSNTAIGEQSLYNNTGGSVNTAVGDHALFSNTLGGGNTANGFWALHENTNGSNNTAVGDFALVNNTIGDSNTAIGAETLEDNTSGFGNTAVGIAALTFNTTGSDNIAIGDRALAFNSTGELNTAIGYGALNHNTTGDNNIAIGQIAGVRITTGSNNIDIGNQGAAGDESRTIRIGKKTAQRNTYIAGISGVTVPGGVGVIVDSDGHLGTVTSSARYKEAITPMDKSSEAILSLKPVSFRYKKELDPEGIPQFGLVAEEVAKVDPDLVAKDEQGKPYTVRYEAVNAMLLNEFLKEHRHVRDQDAIIARQQKQIEALTTGLHKVSAQLETIKPSPQTVSNN